ncbi:MAG: hypothetical protein KKB50_10940 [Planctomycetes bacterium]|nr:hypothetical protein [Planctomycetota bacterium]
MVLHIPDYDAFIDATLTLLRERDFAPRQVDRQRGLIVAGPATSGQWFEFWRVDSQGGYQVLEASLHTIRRTVNINLEPLDGRPEPPPSDMARASQPSSSPENGAADGALPDTAHSQRYNVIVRVDKDRYGAPDRQVTTASGALAIYSERLPTEEGLRGARSESACWVPLGRDPLLEAYLLAKIVDVHPGVTPRD